MSGWFLGENSCEMKQEEEAGRTKGTLSVVSAGCRFLLLGVGHADDFLGLANAQQHRCNPVSAEVMANRRAEAREETPACFSPTIADGTEHVGHQDSLPSAAPRVSRATVFSAGHTQPFFLPPEQRYYTRKHFFPMEMFPWSSSPTRPPPPRSAQRRGMRPDPGCRAR